MNNLKKHLINIHNNEINFINDGKEKQPSKIKKDQIISIFI